MTKYYLLDWITEVKTYFEGVMDGSSPYFAKVLPPYHDPKSYFSDKLKRPMLQILLSPNAPISDNAFEGNTTYTVAFQVYYFRENKAKILEEGLSYLGKIEDMLDQYCIGDDDTHGLTTITKTAINFENNLNTLGFVDSDFDLEHPFHAMALVYDVRINSANLGKA